MDTLTIGPNIEAALPREDIGTILQLYRLVLEFNVQARTHETVFADMWQRAYANPIQAVGVDCTVGGALAKMYQDEQRQENARTVALNRQYRAYHDAARAYETGLLHAIEEIAEVLVQESNTD